MTNPANPGVPVPPRAALLGVVREEFGRVAYTHTMHWKVVARLNTRILFEKRAKALLLTATAGNTVGVLVTSARWAEVTALVLSALALLIEVYGLSRARERLADQHRNTALALWPLRERYIHLIGDLASGALSEEAARARRDELSREVAHVYAAAPPTDPAAYAETQRSLRQEEELTFATWEIDVMLPEALRTAPLPGTPQEREPGWRRLGRRR